MRASAAALAFGLLLAPAAAAESLKGYPPKEGDPVLTYRGRIGEVRERPQEFLLAIPPYAAYYRLPKFSPSGDVRGFLMRRMATGSELIFEINPLTVQILEIRDRN